jgi:hypothetical protein
MGYEKTDQSKICNMCGGSFECIGSPKLFCERLVQTE